MTPRPAGSAPAGLTFAMAARSRTRDIACLALLLMVATAAILTTRGRRFGPESEAAPSGLVSMDSLVPESAPKPSSPRRAETQAAVRRVFADAVVPDARRTVAGDFNGDDAPDLAVVVRPARGALDRINHELANWTLQDAAGRAPGGGRVQVAAQDVLLAVIHGYGAGGWRNPEARQSYLIRNAAGDALTVRARGAAERNLAETGLARLRGDVITQSIGGRRGFVYWSGSRYLWTPVGTAAAGR
jgi:hypothetical protein